MHFIFHIIFCSALFSSSVLFVMGDRDESFEEQNKNYRRRLSNELYNRDAVAILDDSSSEALSSGDESDSDEEGPGNVQFIAPATYQAPVGIVKQPVPVASITFIGQAGKPIINAKKIAYDSDPSGSDDEVDDEEIANTRARLQDLKSRHQQRYPKK